jgi:hypothetical protein
VLNPIFFTVTSTGVESSRRFDPSDIAPIGISSETKEKPPSLQLLPLSIADPDFAFSSKDCSASCSSGVNGIGFQH